jgi:CheY-like chemotaxis protein
MATTDGLELRTLEVLLVEDDDGDVLMTREALHEGAVRNRLTVASDGADALDYLHRRGAHADAVRPDLIILDLNLPRVDGRQVLAEIKQDDDLRRIPVVVFSTSEAPDDVVDSYNLHANAYVSKPADFDRFVEAVQRIDDFFAGIAKLPPR